MTTSKASGGRRRWVFLVARNYGDALIGRGLVARVLASFPMDEVSILTRPEFAEIFDGLQGLQQLYFAQFPMGTRKRFGIKQALDLCLKLAALRRLRLDFFVNDFGDVRETFLGWLTRPRHNAAPVWPRHHPFRRVIRSRGSRLLISYPLPMPEDVLNVYHAHSYMSESLGCPPTAPVVPTVRERTAPVGLHPFATQECRIWPWDQWRTLTKELIQRGHRVRVFGAPGERGILERELGDLAAAGPVEVVTGRLGDFFRGLRELSLLVALDSFAIHAAYAQQTPAVMLNGANDHRLWQPPGTRVLVNGGACPRFPCYCRPSCVGQGEGEYACIRGISAAAVLREIELLQSQSRGRLQSGSM